MSLQSSNDGPLDFVKYQNVVDGKLVASSNGETYHNINPSTLETNPEVPLSASDDVDKAVIAAQKAAESWAKVPWDERKKRLMDFADALEAHTEAFSQMLVKGNGRPPLHQKIIYDKLI
ncbi:hypothetical protein DL770_001431 [Monosporascus sp. CRB-9-2]|nr:hypothetical protein DL770_001431 [Monosporascus sp. CRB-9-2]